MSKETGIKEGGISRMFGPIDRLVTVLKNGGHCAWVPKDERTLTTKIITQNGTYPASADGHAGYSSVVVDVQTSRDYVTGKKQDGNEYVVRRGAGNVLSEEKVPTYIVVTTPPLNLVYGMGAYLVFDGIVVTAYYSDGSVYGVVPFDELIFPIQQAPNEAWQRQGSATSSYYADFPLTDVLDYEYDAHKAYPKTHGEVHFHPEYERHTIFTTREKKTNHYAIDASPTSHSEYDKSFTYNEKTAYGLWNSGGFNGEQLWWTPDIPYYNPEWPEEDATGKAAWTMLYGDIVYSGGFQVPVQWNRPNDGKTLQTSYGITVVDIWNGGADD
jgi:hypothetical protein